MSTTLITRIQIRNDTKANWTTHNPTLLKGEIGIEIDTRKYKIGTGTDAWSALSYASGLAPHVAAAAPETSDYDYEIGQEWIDTTTADDYKIYKLVKVVSTTATWKRLVTADELAGLGYGDMLQSDYDSNSDNVVDEADKVTHTITVTVDGGTTEGTDKFTFDGSAAKTLNLAAGSNITLDDSVPGTITITAGHPTISVGTDSSSSASPAHGGTFAVVDSVTRDGNGHVTAINVKTITLPADNDTITTLATTSTPASVNISGTAGSGAKVLGDAAAKIVATSIPDSPTTDQNNMLPSLAAVKAYADALLAANDAMVFKGTLGTGGTITALPTTYSAGWSYKVITAGTYAGSVCQVGDLAIAILDRAGSGNLDSDWIVVQTNIDGAVTGSDASVTSGHVAMFDGATGRIIKTSGILYTDLLVKTDTFILDGGAST